jgi:hypothetical protein
VLASSNGLSSGSFPKCSDVFAEGAKATYGKNGNWDPTCKDGSSTVIGITATSGCPDGSTVAWTDRGWMHNGIVHPGKLDLDGDGNFTFTDTKLAGDR